MFKSFKIALIIALSITSKTGLSQSIMFGAGGSYGTDIQQFAPNFRIYYGLTEHICFGPEFSYFPSIKHEEVDVQLTEYGFVAHYIFEIKHKAGIYPLIGINYSVENETHNEESHTTSAWGASMGLGVHFNFKNLLPFAEYKFITGELSQSTLSLGLIYNLHFGQKKHSETEEHHE
ncbi:MAG: outer membrane beta-barrel protein [Crocinitomix sp.]|nr:outer membrane beta-barrel protein [Crocinitomix sp.]